MRSIVYYIQYILIQMMHIHVPGRCTKEGAGLRYDVNEMDNYHMWGETELKKKVQEEANYYCSSDESSSFEFDHLMPSRDIEFIGAPKLEKKKDDNLTQETKKNAMNHWETARLAAPARSGNGEKMVLGSRVSVGPVEKNELEHKMRETEMSLMSSSADSIRHHRRKHSKDRESKERSKRDEKKALKDSHHARHLEAIRHAGEARVRKRDIFKGSIAVMSMRGEKEGPLLPDPSHPPPPFTLLTSTTTYRAEGELSGVESTQRV